MLNHFINITLGEKTRAPPEGECFIECKCLLARIIKLLLSLG
jgi:hypothetical protein